MDDATRRDDGRDDDELVEALAIAAWHAVPANGAWDDTAPLPYGRDRATERARVRRYVRAVLARLRSD